MATKDFPFSNPSRQSIYNIYVYIYICVIIYNLSTWAEGVLLLEVWGPVRGLPRNSEGMIKVVYCIAVGVRSFQSLGVYRVWAELQA